MFDGIWTVDPDDEPEEPDDPLDALPVEAILLLIGFFMVAISAVILWPNIFIQPLEQLW